MSLIGIVYKGSKWLWEEKEEARALGDLDFS